MKWVYIDVRGGYASVNPVSDEDVTVVIRDYDARIDEGVCEESKWTKRTVKGGKDGNKVPSEGRE